MTLPVLGFGRTPTSVVSVLELVATIAALATVVVLGRGVPSAPAPERDSGPHTS